jgi:hypothetical protein
MATAKTGSFYLTETVTLPALTASGSRVGATVDLSAYINVPTGQAIAIDSVDFIYQASVDFGSSVVVMMPASGALGVQLTDLNPATSFVRADNHSLVASGSLQIDGQNNIATHVSDIYPDNFGSAANLSEAFMVVNDTLYLTAGPDNGSTGANEVFVTARIRCRVVKLGQKDWIAIAIQSTASE